MATSWREDPRLTTALREFGTVSQDYSSLKSKQQAREPMAPIEMTWQELVTMLWAGCKQRQASKQLRSYLLDLIAQAGEMIGDEETVNVKETLATEIFITTMEFEHVEAGHIAKIKKIVPTTRQDDVRAFHEVVKKIKKSVGERVVENIADQINATRTSVTFGQKIKFSPSIPPLIRHVEEDSDDEIPQFEDRFVDSFKKLSTNHTRIVGISAQLPCRQTSCRCFSLRRQMTIFKTSFLTCWVFDWFDLIQELLQHRNDLVKDIKRKEILNSGQRTKGIDPNPGFGCQVVIQTEQERQASKAFRKEEKRASKKGGINGEGESDPTMDPLDFRLMKEKRELELLRAATAPLFSKRSGPAAIQERYPNVYDSSIGAMQSAAFAGGKKMSLPDGFVAKSTKEYEEIRIPVKNVNLRFNQPLVKIKDLDEVSREAFRGMTQLNRIQSCVFESAFKTNENLLICAPTGAGKTNVAMLTVVREIKRNIEAGVIQRNNFKIVYVAPMKALAAEMTRNFGGRLESLGIKVRELTGDMQLTKSEIAETQMLITTPEKWDVVTRKAVGDTALSQLVRLLIIDEVHLLHDERGPVLETLVARTLRQVETQQSMIRIVGLSATLPNYRDVAEFLRVNP